MGRCRCRKGLNKNKYMSCPSGKGSGRCKIKCWPLWRGLSESKRMDCPPGQNKVAVVERWPLVEVRLYYFIFAFFRTVKASVKRARRIEPQPLACFALALRLPSLS